MACAPRGPLRDVDTVSITDDHITRLDISGKTKEPDLGLNSSEHGQASLIRGARLLDECHIVTAYGLNGKAGLRTLDQ